MNENYRMNQLIGSQADWVSNDIVLGLGEIGLSIQTNGEVLGKIGDGIKLFSQLDYVIGTIAIPLKGTDVDGPVTGLVEFRNTNVNKAFYIGITESLGIDDMIIASTGLNQAQSNLYVSINSLSWQFGNDGKLTAPGVTLGAGDELVLTTKQYVDAAVAGGVSGTYLALTGTAGNPMTGLVEYRNATLNKDYTFGILQGFGVDNLVLAGAGPNKINCSWVIDMNNYKWAFMNTGRILTPDIAYVAGDTLAVVNKKYVDAVLFSLRSELVAAGVAISV